MAPRTLRPWAAMTTKDLALTHHLRQLLTRRQAELRQYLQQAAGVGMVDSDQPYEVLDFKDVAAEDSQAAVTEVTTEKAARELQDIAAALRRIDEGEYGQCEDCGDPVDERRLLALPATRFCTSCQSVHERPKR
jgi:DnaK suppressor protein